MPARWQHHGAVRRRLRLDRAPGDELADRAVAAGDITAEQREWIHEADDARWEAIQVDAFSPEAFVERRR